VMLVTVAALGASSAQRVSEAAIAPAQV